ncbi:sensor histidine kinase [Cohnella sp. JJ-181]|uniref:sensor histidine kinase n=1 Tax=Cohnella rhizoplanae TaxID=2974897 RepID=UPI0022FF8771|nr:histidine kinase N-terminal 7TM domain-containing protein [Cohnella sp. JJ-181]CAI6081719.1 Adaptive-response sensory-kinase SasA [Cohnella sp. JJ-181]
MAVGQWMPALLFAATALMLLIACLAYQKRHLQVARTMIGTMLAASFYAAGYAFELMSGTLRGVKLSLQIEYLGIPFVTACWLLLAIQSTGTAGAVSRRLVGWLMIVPVATFLLHLTNGWHGLVYEAYVLNTDGGLPPYSTVKGPWYAVHAMYNYGILAAGLLLFFPMYWRSQRDSRRQILILIIGAAAPALCNAAFFFGVRFDFTPFGFAVSGLVYAWGIFKFNLLRLTPLALAKVFDTIRDGAVLLDHEDRIVSSNAAAEHIFPALRGAGRSPAHARDIWPDGRELLGRIAAADGREDRFPLVHADGGGRARHYICSLSFLYDRGMSPIGKLLMLSDVTELKENEERLRESARQLSELNAFKDKLFTVMAHDIRDPIALLVSLTELLEEEPAADDPAHADVYREIKGQLRGTFRLVDNLLDWYRSQNGQVAFRPTAWNLGQVVRQALSAAGPRAGMKRIALSCDVDGALSVLADKEMLDLVFRNLLSNAVKFTGMDGAIEVLAERAGDRVRVRVRDDGAGIDEETSRLLRQEELFVKARGFDREGGEMRFGLVLTREFLRLHGGSLAFDSAPGKGTTFVFTLPAAAEAGETAELDGTEATGHERYIG